MWELDCEESWAPKNWCFWTVVLEKTLESPLDCKEIQPVHSKGDQSWVFIGRTDAKSWNSNTLATSCEELTLWKRLWYWEGLGGGGEGDNRGWDGWMASPTRLMWVWVNSGVGAGQGGLVCYNSWGRKESDMTEQLNWTELKPKFVTKKFYFPTASFLAFRSYIVWWEQRWGAYPLYWYAVWLSLCHWPSLLNFFFVK